METYDKIKNDQKANEIVKKGIESEKDPDERPIRLLVSPTDISKYYKEKMKVIELEITSLNVFKSINAPLISVTSLVFQYSILP